MPTIPTVFRLLRLTTLESFTARSFDQMTHFMEKVPDDDLPQWVIQKGEDPWERLDKHDEFLRIRKAAQMSEKRRYRRHRVRLQVTVLTGSRSFTTYSVNLSLGGLYLERAVPANMRVDNCRILLVTPDHHSMIELRGRIASDAESQFRIAFIETEAKSAVSDKSLSRWIERFDRDKSDRKAA